MEIFYRDLNIDLESRSNTKSSRSDKFWGLETRFYISELGMTDWLVPRYISSVHYVRN